MEQPNISTPSFIFVDGSHFIFYRYYALCTWWRNAHATELDVLNDPVSNDIFVDKFTTTFIDKFAEIPKKIGYSTNDNPVIIVGKDCKRKHIWRYNLFPKYKLQRATKTEDGFMGGPFFKMAYECEELFRQAGASKILSHPHLEADDCIALTTKHLLEKYPNCHIDIITSDKDYLQLLEPRVQLYNLGFKKLSEQKSYTGDPQCDLFCKIVSGDMSDNIPSVFPRCGMKTALKYFKCPEQFEKKLLESEEFRTQYQLNKTIIDFNNIPQSLQDEFMTNQSYYLEQLHE